VPEHVGSDFTTQNASDISVIYFFLSSFFLFFLVMDRNFLRFTFNKKEKKNIFHRDKDYHDIPFLRSIAAEILLLLKF